VFQITKTDINGNEQTEPMAINQFDPQTGQYFNDMTIGEYSIVITEQPMQVTFENSQFTQALELRKNGVAVPDSVVIRHSNLSDKNEIIQQMSQQGQPPADPLVEAKKALIEAQTRKADADAVTKNVEGMFSATEAAKNIAMQPAVSPLADNLLSSAGFVDQDAAPIIPTAPEGLPVNPPETNTSPMYPANPATGMNQGIEGGQA